MTNYPSLQLEASSTAYITTNHNRLKAYLPNNIYLTNGQSFELELFNATTNRQKILISINGKLISTSGLVLKPGQRSYLDRFIDSPNKFIFESYVVDGSLASLQAIALNGNIKVEFFNEVSPQPTRNYLKPTSWDYNGGTTYTNSYYSDSSMVQMKTSSLSPSTAGGASADSIETGRVEQGGHSNQKFNHTTGNFETFAATTIEWKILPVSQQPIEIQQLATYCTNCGVRNKKNNYKYCPKCGTKF